MDRDLTMMIYGAIMGVVGSSFLVYRTSDPRLGFAFSAMLGFLLTTRAIKTFKR